MIGSTIAHCRITAKVGEGGMGEVYRATDTKLDREVAIKVLPAAFTEDKERLARFERESKLLDQCLFIARQIAEALEEAHEKGIVHRDLKPQSVKASLEGRVKVLDFGARELSGHRRSGLPVLVAGLAAGRLIHRGPSLLRLSGLSRQTRAPTSTSACKGPTMIEERDDGTRRAAADRARLPRRFGAGSPRDAA